MNDVSSTLAERGARYGAFKDHAAIAQGLQEVLWETAGWYHLQPDVRQMCVVITDKIARILNGDPDYTDNYHDIQGYAKLVEDRLLKEQEERKGVLFEPEAVSETVTEPMSAREQFYEEVLSEHTGIPIEPIFPNGGAKREEEPIVFPTSDRNQVSRDNEARRTLGKGYNPGTGYDG